MAVPEWQYGFYERLRQEILKVAVDDYKTSIRKSKRIGYKCTQEQALENFFLGEWGQLLSNDHGEYIVERCRKDHRYVPSPKSRPQLTKEKQRELIADYLNGINRAELARKYGISERHVYRLVARWV